MSDDVFRRAFDRLERHIEETYGLPVRIRDVPDPFTGDLDGAEIHIDYDNDAEAALFILVHLFGHTVQWNRSERSRELSRLQTTLDGPPSPALRAELQAFEEEARQLSLQLMHDAGITGLDQWVSDYAACDFAYLMHFYDTRGTGEPVRPLRDFWRPGQRLLEPLPIPDFEPRRWVARWQGIVV